jgi:molybdate transport system substrate-binding protein
MFKTGFHRLLLGSLLALVALLALLKWGSPRPSEPGKGRLYVYCAAGLREAFEEVAARYRQEYGIEMETTYEGSGKLLGEIQAGQQGDLFLAADTTFLDDAARLGFLEERTPVASQVPCLVWRPDATQVPSNTSAPNDDALWRAVLAENVKLSLAEPKVAGISRVASRQLQKETLDGQPLWELLMKKATVVRQTVNEVANDVRAGVVDVGIVWDATASQYPELRVTRVAKLDESVQQVELGVLRFSKQPSRALHFLRYLSSRDRGLPIFQKHAYRVVDGDAWSETPELHLFTGGLMHPAIQGAIEEFEKREGVRVVQTPNGCGILVSQIKAGEHPDTYFACDTTFMDSVSDIFPNAKNVSSTEIVLIVSKVRPDCDRIQSLEDIAKPGWKLGLCNPEHSALGALSQRLLEGRGQWEAVKGQVIDWPSTADRLVESLVIGSIDAALVYRANTVRQADKLRVIPVDDPRAQATQPVAVARDSRYPRLAGRLVDRLLSQASQATFESLGFRWLGGSAP